VHFGLAVKDSPTRHAERRFSDPGRAEIRRLSVAEALTLLESVDLHRPGSPSGEAI
jgi:nicotinamide-nucleotide amidase